MTSDSNYLLEPLLFIMFQNLQTLNNGGLAATLSYGRVGPATTVSNGVVGLGGLKQYYRKEGLI